MITQRLKIEKKPPPDWVEGAPYALGDVVSYPPADPETGLNESLAYECMLAFSEGQSITPPPDAKPDWKLLSSYAIPTGNIVKDDGSLFVAWGHNIDNMGEDSALIEDLWSNGKLHSNNANPDIPKIFTVKGISWHFEGTVAGKNQYTFTVNIKETLSNQSLAIGQDTLTFSNVKLTGYITSSGKSYEFILDGTPISYQRGAVSNINVNTNTVTFKQNLPYIINDRSNIAVDNGLTGVKSIEFVLAVLQRNESKIVRACFQLDRFMKNKTTFFTKNDNTRDPGIDPLEKLGQFLNLAVKYDVYIIFNGANTWGGSGATPPNWLPSARGIGQPDWLTWATEEVRWTAQATFWSKIAEKFGQHPAIAWYSLINEPINNNLGNYYINNPSPAFSVIYKQIVNNVATLTLSSTNIYASLSVGDNVTISNVDSIFNGTYVLTSVAYDQYNNILIQYAKNNINVAKTSVSNGKLVLNNALLTYSPDYASTFDSVLEIGICDVVQNSNSIKLKFLYPTISSTIDKTSDDERIKQLIGLQVVSSNGSLPSNTVVVSATPTPSKTAFTTATTPTSGVNQTVLTVANTLDISIGATVSATGILANTKVINISGNNVTLSNPTTSDWATGSLVTFVSSPFPYTLILNNSALSSATDIDLSFKWPFQYAAVSKLYMAGTTTPIYESSYFASVDQNALIEQLGNLLKFIPWERDTPYSPLLIFNPQNFSFDAVEYDGRYYLCKAPLNTNKMPPDSNYWEEVKWNTEFIKYGEAVPDSRQLPINTVLKRITRSGEAPGLPFDGYGDTLNNFFGAFITPLTYDPLDTNPTNVYRQTRNKKNWINNSFGELDLHYNPFLTITPRARSYEGIGRQWIKIMRNAIREFDLNTPITLGTALFPSTGNTTDNLIEQISKSTFGPENTQDLLDLFSPHNYPGDQFNPRTLDGAIEQTKTFFTNLSTGKNYNKPVMIEEGALPYASGPSTVIDYMLKLKRYLIGGLNNVVLAANGWYNDFLNFQDTFDYLKFFINDSPINDVNVNRSDIAFPIMNNDEKGNKNIPVLSGKRHIVPTFDKSSSVTSIKPIYSSSGSPLSAKTYEYSVSTVLSDGKETTSGLAKSLKINSTAPNQKIQVFWNKYQNPVVINSNTATTLPTVYYYKLFKKSTVNSLTNFFLIKNNIQPTNIASDGKKYQSAYFRGINGTNQYETVSFTALGNGNFNVALNKHSASNPFGFSKCQYGMVANSDATGAVNSNGALFVNFGLFEIKEYIDDTHIIVRNTEISDLTKYNNQPFIIFQSSYDPSLTYVDNQTLNPLYAKISSSNNLLSLNHSNSPGIFSTEITSIRIDTSATGGINGSYFASDNLIWEDYPANVAYETASLSGVILIGSEYIKYPSVTRYKSDHNRVFLTATETENITRGYDASLISAHAANAAIYPVGISTGLEVNVVQRVIVKTTEGGTFTLGTDFFHQTSAINVEATAYEVKTALTYFAAANNLSYDNLKVTKISGRDVNTYEVVFDEILNYTNNSNVSIDSKYKDNLTLNQQYGVPADGSFMSRTRLASQNAASNRTGNYSYFSFYNEFDPQIKFDLNSFPISQNQQIDSIQTNLNISDNISSKVKINTNSSSAASDASNGNWSAIQPAGYIETYTSVLNYGRIVDSNGSITAYDHRHAYYEDALKFTPLFPSQNFGVTSNVTPNALNYLQIPFLNFTVPNQRSISDVTVYMFLKVDNFQKVKIQITDGGYSLIDIVNQYRGKWVSTSSTNKYIAGDMVYYSPTDGSQPPSIYMSLIGSNTSPNTSSIVSGGVVNANWAKLYETRASGNFVWIKALIENPDDISAFAEGALNKIRISNSNGLGYTTISKIYAEATLDGLVNLDPNTELVNGTLLAQDEETASVSFNDSSYHYSVDFLGHSYAAALGAAESDDYASNTTNLAGPTLKANRYSTQLTKIISGTEQNHAISGSVLSSNGLIYGVPTAVGQCLNRYGASNLPSQSTNQIYSINFGLNDIASYGSSSSDGKYNSKFFIQTLRVVLSRLKATAITEFTGLSGFTNKVPSIINQSGTTTGQSNVLNVTSTAGLSAGQTITDYNKIPSGTVIQAVNNGTQLQLSNVVPSPGVSGGSTLWIDAEINNLSGANYQRTTSNKTVSFSTAGKTVAIGFVVESGASAQAVITVNGKSYTQSLISGTDVRSGILAPVVKRITNLPDGVNTFTITLTLTTKSACLDYWQVESSAPAATTLVHNIIKLPSYSIYNSIVGTSYTTDNTINIWNTEINSLIANEFNDESTFIVDVDSTFNKTSSYISTDAVHPSDSGHKLISQVCYDVLNANKNVGRNWKQSDSYSIADAAFEFSQTYLDNMAIQLTPSPVEYSNSQQIQGIHINTAYVDVKINETLAIRGNPIATIV